MQQHEILHNYPDSLPQPHFDQEETLISAKPVVPLSVVHSSGRRRSLALFSAAIALSILVGAFGAMFIYSRRPKDEPTEQSSQKTPSTLIPDFPVLGGADGATTLPSEAIVVERGSNPAVAGSVVDERAAAGVTSIQDGKKRLNKAQSDKRSDQLATPKSSEQRHQVKEDRVARGRLQPLDQSREERRPRRVDETQTEMDRNSSSDLFRIREIFEGPRPRRRRNPPALPY